jgi:hypothetical protein
VSRLTRLENVVQLDGGERVAGAAVERLDTSVSGKFHVCLNYR